MSVTLPGRTIDWLLEEGSPAVRYNTRLFFGAEKPARKELLSDPLIASGIKALGGWDGEILERHNTPDLLMHTLTLLADFGVRADDAGMPGVVKKILAHANDRGIPEIVIRIPKAFGGSDTPERSWLICDYPAILHGLLAIGVENAVVEKGLQTLASLVSDNGYRCLGAFPKFHGPGRKEDMCPIACLYAAKAMSGRAETAKGRPASRAVEAILGHWEERKRKKYYLFGIGTDFMKLKFPFVWYNILHVLDAVGRCTRFKKDPRVLEMADVVLEKADDSLRFTPESVYMAFKGKDFSDKKAPSPTLTFMTLRALARLGLVG